MDDKQREEMDWKMKYILSKLKILGYDSVADLDKYLDDSKGYHVLGRIGYDLEFFVSPEYVIQEDIEDYELEMAEDAYFMKNEDKTKKRLRKVYPSYGLYMEDKVSKEDWDLYSEIVRRTGVLIRDLFSGKIPEEYQEDSISELIDSPEFAKACKIEDTFIFNEIQEFQERAEQLGYKKEDEETTQDISEDELEEDMEIVNLTKIVRESIALAGKKQKYLKAIEEYERMLGQLSGNEVQIVSGLNKKKKDVSREYGE